MKGNSSANPSFLYLKIFIGIFILLSLITLLIRSINLIEHKTFNFNGYNVLLLGENDAEVLSFTKDRGVRKMVRLHVTGGGKALAKKSLLSSSMLLGVPLDGAISSDAGLDEVFSFKNSFSALFKSSHIKKNRVGDLDFLLVYAAVNAGHLKILKQTGAKGWIVVTSLVLCLIMFVILEIYTFRKAPEAVYTMIALLIVSFAAEAVWQKFRK